MNLERDWFKIKINSPVVDLNGDAGAHVPPFLPRNSTFFSIVKLQ